METGEHKAEGKPRHAAGLLNLAGVMVAQCAPSDGAELDPL